MIDATQQYSWFQQQVNQAEPSLIGHNIPWLNTLRDHAIQAVDKLPLVSRKQEAWRYSHTEQLLKQNFQPLANQFIDIQELDIDIEENLLPAFDAYRLVFIDGYCVPQLSNISALPGGVILGSLRAVLHTDPELLAGCFESTANHAEHLFTALNTALMDCGVFIHIGKQVELDRPIEVIYLSSVKANGIDQAAGQDNVNMATLRNIVVLESGAKATLIERFGSAHAARYFNNTLTDISLGEGASLGHTRLQDESRQAYHLSSLYLSQQQASHYHGTHLALGGAWARTEYNVNFKQQGGECLLKGLYTAGDQQLTDVHLNVKHTMPDCISREQFKGILYGKGRSVFDGRILVDKHAQHSDAYLGNDNLMLSRDAEVDTKPQLEIYADDVKCSHGTTVGQLDAQQVYYLRSRGIDEKHAKKILCLGFAREIIDAIEVPPLRDYLVDKLTHTLDAAIATQGVERT